ncbi:hypothetical protein HBI55_024740 [Parastagonospora nodorum]|nr:hypothetical protein HBI55_024740 [Parastagonospora nodorum]
MQPKLPREISRYDRSATPCFHICTSLSLTAHRALGNTRLWIPTAASLRCALHFSASVRPKTVSWCHSVTSS